MFKTFALPLTLLLLTLSMTLSAKTPPSEQESAPEGLSKAEVTKDSPPKEDEFVITKHSFKLNGVEINYQAQIGTMTIKDEEGKPSGNMFYIAYTKEGGENNPDRPITFCFNGGPGSSSIWLHLGAFGPQKVALNETGTPLHPYHLVDNDNSILDLTDLVFIDPISTGYSRPAPGVQAKDFHGVEQDVKSVAQFIRLFTTRHGRWESPKYLAGESYGTMRSAQLAYKLQADHCMDIDGIIMISAVINYQAFSFDEGNDLPYLLFLPSYTRTALFHKRLSPDMQANAQKTLEQASEFALNGYAAALMKGDDLQGEERRLIVEKLSLYTGLPANFIEEHDLRIEESQFSKTLLKDQRRFLGRFDSRILGIENANSPKDYCCFDPSLSDVCGAFTATFYQYARSALKWDKDDEYITLANVWPWDFGRGGTNQYIYAGSALRSAMTENPRLRVFVAAGAYDLATPPATAEYSFSHLGLDPALRKNVTMETYPTGHMVYLDKGAFHQLKQDLTRFFNATEEKK